MKNTDCRKCKAPMTELPKPKEGIGGIALATFTITSYRCAKCGHWNNIKRRKQ